jgi:hypothetical protein
MYPWKYWPVGMAGSMVLLLLGCTMGSAATAIPAGRPVNYDVQTITPTVGEEPQTQPGSVEPKAAFVVPLDSAPTHTPDPNVTPSAVAQPNPATGTTTPPVAVSVTAVITRDAIPESPLATPTTMLTTEPTNDPVIASDTGGGALPLEGGEWDFESDFVPWGNPYGEPCPGASVGVGWTAFVEAGAFGSSCFNENLYAPNVFSGLKSQEITFDFIAANSGLHRTIPTTPGHRYSLVAYAKHDRSAAPVQMFLGVEMNGATDWQAESIEWFPWDDPAEDSWVSTEVTVSATGDSMTVFVRGYHPLAEQGGKTVVDTISITDLGAE